MPAGISTHPRHRLDRPVKTASVVVTITVEGLRIPAVSVELRSVDGNVVIAKTTSDGVGQAPSPTCRRALLREVRSATVSRTPSRRRSRLPAARPNRCSSRCGSTFVRESVEVVAPANSPTESLQPVAVSDVLTGAKMDVQPLAGDDFQSLLTVLPSIIRGPEGRLRIKGGAPTTGALQMSSASLNDPSTGDFDLELPSGAVESVEVLSNPFAAEYGRFSTSVTQVRTKRGTNEWHVKPDNLVPGFGKGFAFVNKFEPRLSISGPIKRDRLLFGQYLQYRYRPHAGEEPARRAAARPRQLRLVHPARRGALVAPRADRRRHLLPAQDHQRRRSRRSGRRRRRRSSRRQGSRPALVDRLILSAHVGSGVDGRGAHRSKSTRKPRARCRWSTRRRRRAATSSTARNATSAACSSSRR